jgi:hypothetical protein
MVGQLVYPAHHRNLRVAFDDIFFHTLMAPGV